MSKSEMFTANCNGEIIGEMVAVSYFSLLCYLLAGFWIVSSQNNVYIPYLIERLNVFVQLFVLV